MSRIPPIAVSGIPNGPALALAEGSKTGTGPRHARTRPDPDAMAAAAPASRPALPGKVVRGILLALVLLAVRAQAQPVPASDAASARNSAATLAARIDAFIAQPRFASARWGIDVVDLASGRTLFAHAADKLFVPASNAKLYTTALALHLLGPGARFDTTLYATDRPDGHGLLQGDLILRGGGDPALGTDTGAADGPGWAAALATRLAAAGVVRVRGDLIADDTRFRGPPFGTGWGAGDLFADYAPAVGGLTVGEGTLAVTVSRQGTRCCTIDVQPASAGVRVANLSVDATPDDPSSLLLYRPLGHDTLYVSGSLPRDVRARTYTLAAPDPARMAGQQLLDALAATGIAFDGHLRVLRWPRTDPALDDPHTVRIATLASPPLAQLVRHMLKHSDNLYAQTLLLQAGLRWQHSGRGSCGWVLHWTEQWGLCALRTLLGEIGIDREQAHFSEGSGLSRQDMVSPRATTTLLAWIARQPWATTLSDALPSAGDDGTLTWRLRNLPDGDRVEAKTGTLAHMYTLSGYLVTGAGRRLAFSVMLNNYQRPIEPNGDWAPPYPTHDLDAVVRLIAAYADTPARIPPPSEQTR